MKSLNQKIKELVQNHLDEEQIRITSIRIDWIKPHTIGVRDESIVATIQIISEKGM